MQRVAGQPAYVLHAQPYRETSLLLDVFCRDQGRVGVVARGVRGSRGQPLRVLLQPLQPLHLSWSGRGELAHLDGAEAAGAALRPVGDALLGAFYLNELLLRLLPRSEPQVELFWRYAETLGALQDGGELRWPLRRFERDLLAALGVGFELDCDGDGEPLDPAARYRLDPEHGPSRLRSDRGHGERNAAATGSALLALGADLPPQAADLASLRLPLRAVLAHHLGSRGLKSWEMAASLGRLGRQG